MYIFTETDYNTRLLPVESFFLGLEGRGGGAFEPYKLHPPYKIRINKISSTKNQWWFCKLYSCTYVQSKNFEPLVYTQEVIDRGCRKSNRTGIDTLSIFGMQMRYFSDYLLEFFVFTIYQFFRKIFFLVLYVILVSWFILQDITKFSLPTEKY